MKGRAPDRAAMRRAVDEFLTAAGLEPRRGELAKTSARVVDAWAGEFLAGYRMSPTEALLGRFPVSKKARGLVMVCDLHFRSMCPHHLMPYSGRLHLAYIPRAEVVGFGSLAKLVEVFASRLILQEELAQAIAETLYRELRCAGTACIIEAEQSCFRYRGERQHAAVTVAEAYMGTLRGAPKQKLVWSRLGKLTLRSKA